MASGSTRWRPPAVFTRNEYLLAVLAGIAGLAGSYAVAGYSREFLVAPIEALVVRLTPGGIVAFMIQNVGESAHLLHVGLSIAIGIGLLGAAALGGLALASRLRSEAGVLAAGALAWAHRG